MSDEELKALCECLTKENKKKNDIINNIKILCERQLINNTNCTCYTDEMCLKDILAVIEHKLVEK